MDVVHSQKACACTIDLVNATRVAYLCAPTPMNDRLSSHRPGDNYEQCGSCKPILYIPSHSLFAQSLACGIAQLSHTLLLCQHEWSTTSAHAPHSIEVSSTSQIIAQVSSATLSAVNPQQDASVMTNSWACATCNCTSSTAACQIV